MQSFLIIEGQFFPPIEFFSKIIHFSHITIEAHEHYQKGSFRNRCHIATSQGVHPLSVPLKKGKNAQMPIQDVAIAYDVNWQRQHWQSLKSSYGSAPFWEHYAPILNPFFSKKYTFLFDLNMEILDTCLKILKVKSQVTVSISSEYTPDYTEGVVDLRNLLSPKTPLFNGQKYAQVFEDKHGFLPNLSIIDAMMCCGNQTVNILSA